MITVIGLGFVGLTTALGFSSRGFKVYGHDVDPRRVQALRERRVPFFEPQLEGQLKKNLNKNFFIDVPSEKALKESSFVFFCMGTPHQKGGRADLSFLFQAVKDVLSAASQGRKTLGLVIKSTVPPTTALEKIQPLLERYALQGVRKIILANNVFERYLMNSAVVSDTRKTGALKFL